MCIRDSAVPVPAAPGRGRGRDATGRVQRRPAAAHGGHSLARLAAGVPLFSGALGLGSGWVVREMGRWWAQQDLNLQPTDYESAALTS